MIDTQQMEERTMQLVVDAGNAKSKAMEAMAAAKKGEFAQAEALLAESGASLTKAHQNQTEIIQDSLEENDLPVTLIMAHAEDHMMGAILAKDFAREIIDLHKLIKKNKE